MTIICGKCNKEMQEVDLQGYEFEEGKILENVKAMRCPEGHVAFTEEQAFYMERLTENY